MKGGEVGLTTQRMLELLEIEHECMLRGAHDDCDRNCADCELVQDDYELDEMYTDVISLLKEQEKEIKALRLLVEWAEECDFGFDQFPDEYERYKDEINGMKYIDGMIHIAKRTLEDHGAFEEGR